MLAAHGGKRFLVEPQSRASQRMEHHIMDERISDDVVNALAAPSEFRTRAALTEALADFFLAFPDMAVRVDAVKGDAKEPTLCTQYVAQWPDGRGVALVFEPD